MPLFPPSKQKSNYESAYEVEKSEEELNRFPGNKLTSLFVFSIHRVTVPGYQGNLQAAISHSSALGAWERFGVEFILTFTVVLAYFVSTSSYKRYLGSSAMVLGAAYSACSFVSVSELNWQSHNGDALDKRERERGLNLN